MWMIAVCCTRRVSICDSRDNPLRDFIRAAPHAEQKYNFSVRIGGCKGGVICARRRRFKSPRRKPPGGSHGPSLATSSTTAFSRFFTFEIYERVGAGTLDLYRVKVPFNGA